MIRKSIPFIFALAFGLIGFSAYTLLSQSTPAPSQDNPQQTSTSIEEQKQLVIQYINESNSVGAKVALEQLITTYGNTAEVVPAVYEIAEVYRSKAQFASAITSCQFILANFPESEKAIWAQRSLASSYIGLKDYASAKTASDKLITDYSGNTNIAQAVFEVGDAYYWFGKNKEAQELYQKVIDSWPAAEHSMWAQMGLAISYIADSNDAAARQATDRFAANYASSEKLPEALTYIAARYVWGKKYEQGLDIYSDIIEKFPGNTWAEGAKFESAKVTVYPFIDANDEPNTLAAIDSLINGFKEKAELPAAIYDFATRIDWKNKYEPNRLSVSVYQKVIDNFPDNLNATKSKINIERINITSLINSGDDVNAFSKIDKMVNEYNKIPDLPNAISTIALKYYNKGLRLHNEGNLDTSSEYYRKSIAIREIVIKKLPDSDFTPQSYYLAAVLYSDYLKQYQKGIEYFQKVVDTWPDFEFTWNAQFFIGYYYKILRDSGTMTPLEANTKIEQAYETFIKKYPDNYLAPHVALDLGKINFLKEQWLSASIYFQIYLAKFPDQLGSVILMLGQSYEKMGQQDIAIDLYRAFIESDGSSNPLASTIKLRIEALEGQEK